MAGLFIRSNVYRLVAGVLVLLQLGLIATWLLSPPAMTRQQHQRWCEEQHRGDPVGQSLCDSGDFAQHSSGTCVVWMVLPMLGASALLLRRAKSVDASQPQQA